MSEVWKPAAIESKACTRCKREQPIGEFKRDSGSADGYSYQCRECRTRPAYLKKCAHCKAEKPRAAFSKASKSRDGLQSHCRECMVILRRKIARTGTIQERKTCSACGELLVMTKFHKDASKEDGRARECKPCSRAKREFAYAKATGQREEERVAAVTVEHEIGTTGWRRMIEDERKRTEDAFARMRANREEVMGR